MSIDSLYNELEAARVSWNGLYELLVQGKYDFSRQRPVLDQQPMSMFRRRVDLVIEVLFALRPKTPEDVAHVVLSSSLPEMRKQVQAFQRNAESVLNQLRTNWRDETTLQDGNDNFLWQLLEASTAYTSVDVTSNFQQMHPAINYLIATVGAIVPLCESDSVGDLSARAEALGNTVREAESLRKQAQQHAKTAEASATRAADHEKLAIDAKTQAETVVATLRELLNQANADSGSVTSLVEQIKLIGSGAEKLAEIVTNYQNKFDAFQNELNNRNNEFARFQADAKAAKDSNLTREGEIDRLTNLADSMISGATTAGLGKSLEDTRKRYEERMNGARTGFLWSVALLILSALPLAAHLLPGLLGDLFPKISDAAHDSWHGVLGKVLLMIPATWLTGFYTKSYADSFHLEREYAHKAALAGAVDGFKRQAPKYEEEITAEVFLEIRNNPAKGNIVEPASHPLYDVLSKMVGKVLDRQKGG